MLPDIICDIYIQRTMKDTSETGNIKSRIGPLVSAKDVEFQMNLSF